LSKILVVDDEPTLVATLKFNLEREGHKVVTAADGEAALQYARSEHPDLILLDLMLPVLSGVEVCRILRKETGIPILMLTAKDSEIDKVVGLELGADDYVTKPFSLRELLARIKALLRRADGAGPSAAGAELSSGDLRLDVGRREAFRSGVFLALKPKELELLAFFLRNRGRILSREEIMSQVWGYDYGDDSRTVDVHVRWIRKKIEEDPDRPVRLITSRGAGYRFEG